MAANGWVMVSVVSGDSVIDGSATLQFPSRRINGGFTARLISTHVLCG
jgi:hypothetical protein